MAMCEMCGGSGPLKKTQVEGATLKLCEACQDTGQVVESPATQAANASPSQQQDSSGGTEQELAPDYGSRVKAAREEAGWSVGDLAGELKEKNSVIRRIESESLRPNEQLAAKLERKLDITLYENLTATGVADSTAEENATIGDIADVTRED